MQIATTVHKPAHVKTKQQNVTKLQQLFIEKKFISLVSLIIKLTLSVLIMKKTRTIYTKILMNEISQWSLMDTQYAEV